MRIITDRLRVFAFGIAVSILGLINPSRALQAVADVLNRQDYIDREVDRLHR